MRMKLIGIFLIYLALAIVMTWPLTANLTTHILGYGGDGPMFLWDAWWMREFLFNGQPLFETGHMFFPQTVSLSFHTLTLVNSFVIALLSLFMSLVTASNIYFLISIALSGFSMFLLVRYITKLYWPAFISGILFAFAPYVTAHWLGHYNLVTLWFLPLFVLLMILSVQKKQWHWPVLTGLVAGLASLNDFYNFAFMAIFAFIFIVWLLVVRWGKLGWDLLRKIVIALVVWLGVWSIWLVPALKALSSGQGSSNMSLWEINQYSADLLRYVAPSFLNPLTGWIAHLLPGRFGGGVENTIFLGYVPLIIVVALFVYLWRKKIKDRFFPGIWLWVISGGVFFLLSLGPQLKIAERITSITMPYSWLYQLSDLWGGFRVPARFSLMVMFAVIILVGIALSYFVTKLRNARVRNLLMSLLATLVLIEFMVAPYHLQDLRIPAVYEIVKNDTDSESLIDIPWGINSGYWDEGQFVSWFVYYGTYHGKKLAIGSASRTPREVFDFYPDGELPLARPRAIGLNGRSIRQNAFPNKWQTDWVIIHKNYLSSTDIAEYTRYFERIGYEQVFEDDTEIAYKVI